MKPQSDILDWDDVLFSMMLQTSRLCLMLSCAYCTTYSNISFHAYRIYGLAHLLSQRPHPLLEAHALICSILYQ